MNYDMNLIKYRKSGFFRIAAAILMICFTLFGLTACADTTDSKDNNDDNALIQGTLVLVINLLTISLCG